PGPAGQPTLPALRTTPRRSGADFRGARPRRASLRRRDPTANPVPTATTPDYTSACIKTFPKPHASYPTRVSASTNIMREDCNFWGRGGPRKLGDSSPQVWERPRVKEFSRDLIFPHYFRAALRQFGVIASLVSFG